MKTGLKSKEDEEEVSEKHIEEQEKGKEEVPEEHIEENYKYDDNDDEGPHLITDDEDSEDDERDVEGEQEPEEDEDEEIQLVQASKEEIAEITGVTPEATKSIEDNSPVTTVSDDEDDENEDHQPESSLRRSGRVKQMIQRFTPGTHNVQWKDEQLHNITSDNPKELATYDNEISATMKRMRMRINNLNQVYKDWAESSK